jgi:hypothetical protein
VRWVVLDRIVGLRLGERVFGERLRLERLGLWFRLRLGVGVDGRRRARRGGEGLWRRGGRGPVAAALSAACSALRSRGGALVRRSIVGRPRQT